MPSNGRRDLIRRLNVNRITNLVNGIVVSQFYGTCMHGQLAYRLENDKSRGHSKGRLYCMEYPCSTVCSLSKKKKKYISASFLFHFTPLPTSTHIHRTLFDVPG